jgi:FkbM family methyltransferase
MAQGKIGLSAVSSFASAIFREDKEQAILADYLPAKGFFVEVGAFDPVVFSQTWALEQRGWDGLLVEPVPAQAQALRERRRARVIEAACGPPELHGTTAAMTLAGGRSHLGEGGAEGPTIQVPVRTLDSMLVAAGVTAIDFLSIDVEGLEVDVLRGLSLDRFRPKLILLEDFAEDQTKHAFLRARGYKRVRRTGNNSWYVPHDLPFAVSRYGRWQLLRKYHLSVPIRTLKRLIKRLL